MGSVIAEDTSADSAKVSHSTSSSFPLGLWTSFCEGALVRHSEKLSEESLDNFLTHTCLSWSQCFHDFMDIFKINSSGSNEHYIPVLWFLTPSLKSCSSSQSPGVMLDCRDALPVKAMQGFTIVWNLPTALKSSPALHTDSLAANVEVNWHDRQKRKLRVKIYKMQILDKRYK